MDSLAEKGSFDPLLGDAAPRSPVEPAGDAPGERIQSLPLLLIGDHARDLGVSGIRVDRPRDRFEPDTGLHRERELMDEVARPLRDDRGAKDAISPPAGEHLCEPRLLALDDGAVDLVHRLTVQVVGDPAADRLLFVEADSGELRARERAPGKDGKVYF